MNRLPSRDFWHKLWGKASVVIVVLALAAGIYGLAWGLNNSFVVRQQSAEIIALTRQSITSGNRHHAETAKQNAHLQQALDELKQAAAAIEYEGGVIAYQNGELNQKDDAIIAAQQQGHALLMTVQALALQLSQAETSVGAALVKGQAQINAYLAYLTCLGTHPATAELDNIAICGTPPPLPPT